MVTADGLEDRNRKLGGILIGVVLALGSPIAVAYTFRRELKD